VKREGGGTVTACARNNCFGESIFRALVPTCNGFLRSFTLKKPHSTSQAPSTLTRPSAPSNPMFRATLSYLDSPPLMHHYLASAASASTRLTP